MMMRGAVLTILGLVWLAGAEILWEKHEERFRFCSWKCMKFVQMWPGSFCVALGPRFDCIIPESADSWTIHGLWPSNIMNCCSCWHLFPSDLMESRVAEAWDLRWVHGGLELPQQVLRGGPRPSHYVQHRRSIPESRDHPVLQSQLPAQHPPGGSGARHGEGAGAAVCDRPPGSPGPGAAQGLSLQQLLGRVLGGGNPGFLPLPALQKPDTRLLLPSEPEESTGPLPLTGGG
ncbi:uncharacterized protein [Emydura macquarii macquarii]|uniref:uncharacterized protein isoform X2 n=1 Tax=Emydura macquarii macquarii TaxID=1129001 RepID=UPI00352BBC8B